MSAIETYAVSRDISGKRFLAALGTAVGASAVTGALSYVLLRFLNSSSRSQAAPIWFAGIEVAREWPARKSRCVPRLLPRNHPGFEAGNDAVGNGLIDTRPVADACFLHGVTPLAVAVAFACPLAKRRHGTCRTPKWRTRG